MLVAKPKGQSVTFSMSRLFFLFIFLVLDKHRKQRCKSVFVGKQILVERQQKAFDS